MERPTGSLGPVLALMAALGVVCVPPCAAQAPVEFTYEIHFSGPVNGMSAKYLTEGLKAQDPVIEIWIDAPTQSALARTYVQLDAAELQVAIAPAGLVIGYMGLLGNGHPAEEVRDNGSLFPTYIDTGDPAHDQAAFIAAKALWFTHNPWSPEAIGQ